MPVGICMRVLKCVAGCCRVLQGVAVCGVVWRCAAVCCGVLVAAVAGVEQSGRQCLCVCVC